mmetsp:Transcript_12981/g.37482  ORF Transcript_12981/g.37482 Transcript_12981/m.37482 type:complete len:120 (-) Transcript_12981:7-366(-)
MKHRQSETIIMEFPVFLSFQIVGAAKKAGLLGNAFLQTLRTRHNEDNWQRKSKKDTNPWYLNASDDKLSTLLDFRNAPQEPRRATSQPPPNRKPTSWIGDARWCSNYVIEERWHLCERA